MKMSDFRSIKFNWTPLWGKFFVFNPSDEQLLIEIKKVIAERSTNSTNFKDHVEILTQCYTISKEDILRLEILLILIPILHEYARSINPVVLNQEFYFWIRHWVSISERLY